MRSDRVYEGSSWDPSKALERQGKTLSKTKTTTKEETDTMGFFFPQKDQMDSFFPPERSVWS
jgi:hypothetical protein